MNKKVIFLVGGGGHCLSVIDVIESTDKFIIGGIIDIESKVGTNVLGYKYIGVDSDLPKYINSENQFIVTVGQIENNFLRFKLFNLLKTLKADIASIISPTAYISKHAIIGEGTVVMHRSFVNAGTFIGANNIINTGSLVEHNCKIFNHCHLSTNSVINGDVIIEDNCFVGSNSVVRNGIVIKNNTIIGAGSVVVKDTESNTVIIGNPASKISK